MSLEMLSFSIAEMNTCLKIGTPLSSRVSNFLTNYEAFLSNDASGSFDIDLIVEAGDVFIPVIPGPLEIRTRVEGSRVEFKSYTEKGWFDLEQRHGRLILRPEGNPENFLRVLYAWRSLEENGLLLHASGIIRNDRAYVFFGPSGSGKTTAVSLTPDGIVLSDDLVIIKVKPVDEKSLIIVYGVPFRGELPDISRTNVAALVQGIYRLRQSGDHRVIKFPPSKAVAEMAASIPFVMEHPSNAWRALQICKQIEVNTPVNELHFRKDPGFWNAIEPAQVD